MLQSTTSTSRYLDTKDEPEQNDTPAVPIQSILYEEVWPDFSKLWTDFSSVLCTRGNLDEK